MSEPLKEFDDVESFYTKKLEEFKAIPTSELIATFSAVSATLVLARGITVQSLVYGLTEAAKNDQVMN